MAKLNGKDIIFSPHIHISSDVKHEQITNTPGADAGSLVMANPLEAVPDLVVVRATSGTPVAATTTGIVIFKADLLGLLGREWTDEAGKTHMTVATQNYGAAGTSYTVMAAADIKEMQEETTAQSLKLKCASGRYFTAGVTYTIDVYKGILGG